MPPPPPPGYGRSTPHPGGSRVLMVLVGVGLLVTFSLIALAGVAVYFAASSPSSTALSAVPANIADHVFFCDYFHLTTGSVYPDPGNARHYVFSGQCPAAALTLQDSYIHELEYRGWTVAYDGAGNFSAYNYARREVLNASITDSNDTPNSSLMTVELVTNSPPPADFGPGPSPGPSPSPKLQ